MTQLQTVTPVPAGTHVVSPDAIAWTNKETELIATVIAPGIANDPIAMRAFATICRHTGLDPFAKQIYAWKDKGLVIHIAVGGWRAMASRSTEYRGQVGPEWCGPDGHWRDVWLEETPPAAARVGVLRAGFERPLWATVTWKEFQRTQARRGAKGPTPWDEQPAHMLATRAEAHALQRAFSEMYERVASVAKDAMASVDTETGEIMAQQLSEARDVTPVDEGEVEGDERVIDGVSAAPVDAAVPASPSLALPADAKSDEAREWWTLVNSLATEAGVGSRALAAVVGGMWSTAPALAWCREHDTDAAGLVDAAKAKGEAK